jgi:hypothetical protein
MKDRRKEITGGKARAIQRADHPTRGLAAHITSSKRTSNLKTTGLNYKSVTRYITPRLASYGADNGLVGRR